MCTYAWYTQIYLCSTLTHVCDPCKDHIHVAMYYVAELWQFRYIKTMMQATLFFTIY